MAGKRRTKGDGALFKRADGFWVGRVEITSHDGKRRRKTVASRNRNTALAKLRELKAKVAAGALPNTDKTTVTEWMHHWLNNIHGPTVKPTTLKSYSNTVRLYIVPTVGHKRLDRLTPEDVRAMHRTLQATSTRNAQKAHQVLQRALKDAVNEGLLIRNVAAVVAKPKHVKAQRESFTYEQCVHIIATAFAGDDMYGTRVAAGFTTGARQGETLGLEWSRVDLKNGVLDFSWQLQQLQKVHGCGDEPCGMKRVSACPQAHWEFPPGFEHRLVERSLVLTRPKSAAGTRIVPMTSALHTALTTLRAADDTNPYGLVFHHPDGTPVTPFQDAKMWKRLLEGAGVAHAPLHTMRHSTATLLMHAGVDSHVIQTIIGHSDIITTRSYQHVDTTLTRHAVDNLNGLISLPAPAP